MKINVFFLTMATAAIFASCNNDEDVMTNPIAKPVLQGEPASVVISVTGENNGLQNRASGNEGTDESKVNNGIIYIFDANNNVIKKAFFKASDFTASPTTKVVTTTTAARNVSVLMNVGVSDSASLAGTPYDVPTKAQLEALTVDLAASAGTGVATQVKNNLIMSGVSTAAITFSGDPKTATIPVTVSRIASRVKINWVFTPSSTFVGKIRLTGAVVLNARSNSKLYGMPLYPATGSKFIEGLPGATLSGFPFSGYKPATADLISNVSEYSVSPFAVPQGGENHFYIFENAALYPTIIAIEADYNEFGLDNGANQKKYYPVVINKASTGGQDGSLTVKRNNQYNVTVTVKGVGVDNPFEPVDPASLDVVITVAPWNLAISVNQSFE